MTIPRVDIGIACSAHQIPAWWGTLFANLMIESDRGNWQRGQLFAVQSALPDHNKNHTVGGVFADPIFKLRNERTDANRCAISGYFLEGAESGTKSDWLFWCDDDTVFTDGTISHLLRLDKPFVAGLYFNTNPPYNPIAYKKIDNGGYIPLWDYDAGGLFQVDAVGMGCTLIHRSVYEKIIEEHEVWQRPNGSLIPMHKSNIHVTAQGPSMDGIVGSSKEQIIDGHLIQKLVKPILDDQRKLFPFYLMEHGRTEDMHFCELAANVGFKPWVDTTIVCEHWKHKPTRYNDYRQEFIRREIDGSADEKPEAKE